MNQSSAYESTRSGTPEGWRTKSAKLSHITRHLCGAALSAWVGLGLGLGLGLANPNRLGLGLANPNRLGLRLANPNPNPNPTLCGAGLSACGLGARSTGHVASTR